MDSRQIWDKINKSVFVIAELGKNFIQTEEERPVAEYLKNAKRLVKAAHDAGADAVKFQTHNADDEQLNVKIVAPHFSGERYAWVTRNQKATPINEFWKPLKAYCDELGIIFFSTPMSRGAAHILDKVGVDIWKVGSSDILDFPMLDHIRRSGKPIILSSGMSTIEELDLAVNFIKEENNKIALLHCVSKYPCPPEELNFGAIKFLEHRYGFPTGFSDHSIGVEVALGAVALGAKIIEKHFSFSRDLWGSDHKVSMTPGELKELTDGIKKIEKNPLVREEYLSEEYLSKDIVKRALGNGQKSLSSDEAKFRPVMRKALMAGRDIPVGAVITSEMVYAMRPYQYAVDLGALPSERYEFVLGKKVTQDIKKFAPISEAVLI